MNFDKYPLQYRDSLRLRPIGNVGKRYIKSYSKHGHSVVGYECELKQKTKNSMANGGVLGLVAGIFCCIIGCASSFMSAIMLCVFFIFIGVILPNVKYTRILADREELYKLIEKEYLHYLKEFEASAEKMSVSFDESLQIKKVTDLIASDCISKIEKADRGKHIQQINLEIPFDVHSNFIYTGFDTFDFNTERCAQLQTALEQASMARLLAHKVLLKIETRYPIDISGTPINIQATYDYSEIYSKVIIKYTASNGNYKEVVGWTTD